MTTVINCRSSNHEGDNYVYIGRPSKWGNLFIIGRDGSREEVIKRYKDWLMAQPILLKAIKTELKDKILVCWCKPEACHGDILAEIANEKPI